MSKIYNIHEPKNYGLARCHCEETKGSLVTPTDFLDLPYLGRLLFVPEPVSDHQTFVLLHKVADVTFNASARQAFV